MKRVVHISKNFKEADDWDVMQCISMTAVQRQKAAFELKKRVFGEDTPDVRESHGR